MKNLLKSDICGSHKQCMGPTDVIKGRKSKKSRLLFMYSSRCPLLQLTKKKKQKILKGENANHKTQRRFQCYPNGYYIAVIGFFNIQFFYSWLLTCRFYLV